MKSFPVALVGLPGAVTAELRAAVAEHFGRPIIELQPDYSMPPDLATATSTVITVWVDADDKLLAERSPHQNRDQIQLLRRQHLNRLTMLADAIVAVQGGSGETRSVETMVAAIADAVEHAAGQDRRRVVTETVALNDGRAYPVHVGRGAVELLPEVLPSRAQRVAIITQESIGIEVESGREQRTFFVEDGEQAKRLDVVGQLASALARWEMTRADVIVSIGGGVVSDLAGYLAASYHRGVPVIHISTTLLGQIDAAIGGKCGVNLPEGKNLVGAFWQPTAVLCEIDSLSTLPPREFLSGMGELAKYHFLGGGELDRLPLVERVAQSARIKSDVVSGDEREGGRRAILNYGHTLAHALETAGRYGLRHGEAVAVGLIYAAELAHRLGRIDAERVAEHHRVIARYGLIATVPGHFDRAEVVDLFHRDKKSIDGVTFVLDGPNGVEPVRVDDNELLLEVFDTVSA